MRRLDVGDIARLVRCRSRSPKSAPCSARGVPDRTQRIPIALIKELIAERACGRPAVVDGQRRTVGVVFERRENGVRINLASRAAGSNRPARSALPADTSRASDALRTLGSGRTCRAAISGRAGGPLFDHRNGDQQRERAGRECSHGASPEKGSQRHGLPQTAAPSGRVDVKRLRIDHARTRRPRGYRSSAVSQLSVDPLRSRPPRLPGASRWSVMTPHTRSANRSKVQCVLLTSQAPDELDASLAVASGCSPRAVGACAASSDEPIPATRCPHRRSWTAGSAGSALPRLSFANPAAKAHASDGAATPAAR